MSPVCVQRCVSIQMMLPPKMYTHFRGKSKRLTCIAVMLKDLSLFPLSSSTPQINGIALDNKSVTECETLLRSCRDSLSLSLMKVGCSHLTLLVPFLPLLCWKCWKSSRTFFLLLLALHSSFITSTMWFGKTEILAYLMHPHLFCLCHLEKTNNKENTF